MSKEDWFDSHVIIDLGGFNNKDDKTPPALCPKIVIFLSLFFTWRVVEAERWR